MSSIAHYMAYISGEKGCFEDIKRVIKVGYTSLFRALLNDVTFTREALVRGLFYAIENGTSSHVDFLLAEIEDLTDNDVTVVKNHYGDPHSMSTLGYAYRVYYLSPTGDNKTKYHLLISKGLSHDKAIRDLKAQKDPRLQHYAQRLHREYQDSIKPKTPTMLNMPTPQALTEAPAPEEPIASRFMVVNGFVLNTSEFSVLGRLSSAFNSYDLEMQKRTGIPHRERLYKKGFDHE